jgi:hypothetical protein
MRKMKKNLSLKKRPSSRNVGKSAHRNSVLSRKDGRKFGYKPPGKPEDESLILG